MMFPSAWLPSLAAASSPPADQPSINASALKVEALLPLLPSLGMALLLGAPVLSSAYLTVRRRAGKDADGHRVLIFLTTGAAIIAGLLLLLVPFAIAANPNPPTADIQTPLYGLVLFGGGVGLVLVTLTLALLLGIPDKPLPCGFRCECGNACPCETACSPAPPRRRGRLWRIITLNRAPRTPRIRRALFDGAVRADYTPACGRSCVCGRPCPCSAPCTCKPLPTSLINLYHHQIREHIHYREHGSHNHAIPLIPSPPHPLSNYGPLN